MAVCPECHSGNTARILGTDEYWCRVCQFVFWVPWQQSGASSRPSLLRIFWRDLWPLAIALAAWVAVDVAIGYPNIPLWQLAAHDILVMLVGALAWHWPRGEKDASPSA